MSRQCTRKITALQAFRKIPQFERASERIVGFPSRQIFYWKWELNSLPEKFCLTVACHKKKTDSFLLLVTFSSLQSEIIASRKKITLYFVQFLVTSFRACSKIYAENARQREEHAINTFRAAAKICTFLIRMLRGFD